jgi:hypothetical protein
VCRGRGEDWDINDVRCHFIDAPYNGYAVAHASGQPRWGDGL